MSFCYRCAFSIVCTLSSHLAQPFPRTSDATLLVLHTFSIRTADVTLLILQISSSNSTPCLPAENVAYWCCSLSSHTAQPYPHNRQPSPHTADATLLILHTFSPGTADVTFLILQNFSSHHATCFYCTCNPSDTVKSLLTLHNVVIFPSYVLYFSSAAKSSPRTPDETLLVLNTFFIGTTGVAILIMKTFSSHHTPCRPAAAVTLLTLYTL